MPSSLDLSAQQILLVECGQGSMDELASRARALGMDPQPVSGIAGATSYLAGGQHPVAAVVLPTTLPLKNLKAELAKLRRAGPASGLSFISVGRAPAKAERKQLRSAGVTLALWDPIDDGALRFQLNRALTGDRDAHGRRSPRVPTFLTARCQVGGRCKDAVVYSLSYGGAFLETPRASMDGANLELEIHLPRYTLHAQAQVMFCNVPGNLQRPNLPLGMGVRFEHLGKEDTRAVQEYVEERLAQLNV